MKPMNRILALLLCLLIGTAYLPGPLLASAVTADVPKITLSEQIAEPGEDVTVSVKLSENPGIMVMLFEISYDHTLLTLTGYEDAGLTGWERKDHDDYILWLGEADSSFNGTILKLNFHVSDTVEPGDIAVTFLCSSGDVGNHDEEAFLPEITAGKIHIHGWGEATYTWSEDKSTVTATRACTQDATHVETETVNTTSAVTKAATCEAKGETTYTATFTNTAFSAQTKTVTNIPSTGHDYDTPTYTWSDDNSSVTAKVICKNDASHVVEETVITTYAVTTAPARETAGEGTYTAAFTNALFSTQTKTVTIPATGHDYGTPIYTWSEDNSSVTAKVVCKNDASHVVEETVSTTYTITTPSTCEAVGMGTYTATFTNALFSTQTKTVAIPATGHGYELTGWTWTGYTAATATFTCKNDAAHIETANATISNVRTEPTCEADGSVVYTATVTFEGQTYTDTKTETLVKLGHDYDTPTYTWSEDNSTVTAKVVCKNDVSHVVEETVSTTYAVTTPAACEAAGVGTYTATFTNLLFSTQTKTVAIPATGHGYELTGWTWTGYTAATATFTCKNDAAHIETANATISSVRTEPTCEADGSVVYTATVTFEGQTYTDTKTETLPAIERVEPVITAKIKDGDLYFEVALPPEIQPEDAQVLIAWYEDTGRMAGCTIQEAGGGTLLGIDTDYTYKLMLTGKDFRSLAPAAVP